MSGLPCQSLLAVSFSFPGIPALVGCLIGNHTIDVGIDSLVKRVDSCSLRMASRCDCVMSLFSSLPLS